MPTYRADKRNSDGVLLNIFAGCSCLPWMLCGCGGAHSAESPGCARVTLSAWPANGQIGPFTFNQTGTDAHGFPLGTAAQNITNAKDFWLVKLLDAEKGKGDATIAKTRLQALGAPTTDIQAKIDQYEADAAAAGAQLQALG